jgi:hypothetical protein
MSCCRGQGDQKGVLHGSHVVPEQIIEVDSNLIDRIFKVCLRQDILSISDLIDQSNRVMETDAMRAFILARLLNDTSYLITLTKLGLFSLSRYRKLRRGFHIRSACC